MEEHPKENPVFYPWSEKFACQEQILTEVKDAILSKIRPLINVWGPSGCGKSCTLGRLAQELRREGQRVAWWNCRSDEKDIDLVSLVLQTLRQMPDGPPPQDGGEFQRDSVRLRLAKEVELLEKVIAKLEELGAILFLDNFHNVEPADPLGKFTQQAIPKLKQATVVVVSRTRMHRLFDLSDDVVAPHILPHTESNWALVEAKDLERLRLSSEAVTEWLASHPLFVHYSFFLQFLLSKQSGAGATEGLEQQVQSNPDHLLKWVFDSLPPEKQRVLATACLVRGPRPAALLESIAKSKHLSEDECKSMASDLASLGLMAFQPPEEGHTGRFAVSEGIALGVLLLREYGEQLNDMHLDIAAWYEEDVKRRSGSLRDRLPELGEAVHHYMASWHHDRAYRLIQDNETNLERESEFPRLRQWLAKILPHMEAQNPVTAVSILFHLADIARRITNPDELLGYVSHAAQLTDLHKLRDTGRLDFHRAVADMIKGDFHHAKARLEMALEKARTQNEGPFERQVLLRMARNHLLRGEIAAAIHCAMQVARQLSQVNQADTSKDRNFLYSLFCEMSLTMGFAQRAVQYGRKALEIAPTTNPFRLAISHFWVARALLLRSEFKLTGNERTNLLGDAVEHVDQMIREYERAGSIDKWWGMDFLMTKAMLRLTQEDIDSPEEGACYHIAEAKKISQGPCLRSQIHILLLEAECAAQRFEKALPDTQKHCAETEEKVLAALERMGALRASSLWAAEKARAYELLGRVDSLALDERPIDHLRNATKLYLHGRQFFYAGRCFRRIAALNQDGNPPAELLYASHWGRILSEDLLLEPDFVVPQDDMEFLKDLENRILMPVTMPHDHWEIMESPQVQIEGCRGLLEQIAAVKKPTVRPGRPLNDEEKDLAEALSDRFLSVRESIEKLQATIEEILEELRKSRRHQCTRIKCQLLEKANGNEPPWERKLAKGHSVDLSRHGALLSIDSTLQTAQRDLPQDKHVILHAQFPDGHETFFSSRVTRLPFAFNDLMGGVIKYPTGVALLFKQPLDDNKILCFRYDPCKHSASCPCPDYL